MIIGYAGVISVFPYISNVSLRSISLRQKHLAAMCVLLNQNAASLVGRKTPSASGISSPALIICEKLERAPSLYCVQMILYFIPSYYIAHIIPDNECFVGSTYDTLDIAILHLYGT